MLVAVLVLLVLSQDGISFHLPKGGTHILRKLSADSSMSKILGGTRAERGEFPFIVSLELHGHHMCGGSVISDNWLVTASHCIDDSYYREGLVIRAGSMTKEEGGTVHEIEEIIAYPDYDIDPKFDSDIALIKVKSPFSANEYIKPVHLGKKKDIPEDGTDVVSAGWGVTTKTGYGGTSKELLKVTLQAVDSNKCDIMPGIERIRSMMSYSHIKINDNMICAITQDKDTTKGDSGGPLLKYVNGGTEPLLVGVVSWGEGKGDVDSPGVYSKVANFIKWIYLLTVTLPK